jgi:hypothetical protein
LEKRSAAINGFILLGATFKFPEKKKFRGTSKTIAQHKPPIRADMVRWIELVGYPWLELIILQLRDTMGLPPTWAWCV